MLLVEIEHCKARLRQTWAILEAKKHEKAMAQPMAQGKEQEHWHRVNTTDEAVVYQFKKSGYPIRKIGLHSYEVLMNPQKAKRQLGVELEIAI